MAEAVVRLFSQFGWSSPRGCAAMAHTSISMKAQKPMHVCRHLSACARRSMDRRLDGQHLCVLRAPLAQSTVAILQHRLHRHYSSEASGSSPATRMMPFEEYRKLKKDLKLRARISGLPMALVGILASSAINVHFNPNMLTPVPEEEIQLVLGMDPIAIAVLCGLGSGVVGYMVGGALFNGTWRFLARSKAKQLQERDEDFLERIQRRRSSQFNRFHDDYYGDKIRTLSDYRQWIRQQQEADRGKRLRQAAASEEGAA